MAGPTFATVDLARIPAVGLSHGAAQRFGARWDDDQVNMVGHQAVRPDLDPRAAAGLGHERDVESVVVGAEEGALPAVAALGEVVRQIGNHGAGHSSHAPGLPATARGDRPATYVGPQRRWDV